MDAEPRIRNRPVRLPRAAPGVDQAAKVREQLRRAMDFVDDDQAIGVHPEKEQGLGQPGAIEARLEVEVEGALDLGDLVGEGRLPHLAWTDQRHRRLAGQGNPEGFRRTSIYHPCKLKKSVSICKESGTHAAIPASVGK